MRGRTPRGTSGCIRGLLTRDGQILQGARSRSCSVHLLLVDGASF
ncbi:hypothetical protein ACFPRL_18335 [Pseudoclavibacter helvolus]